MFSHCPVLNHFHFIPEASLRQKGNPGILWNLASASIHPCPQTGRNRGEIIPAWLPPAPLAALPKDGQPGRAGLRVTRGVGNGWLPPPASTQSPRPSLPGSSGGMVPSAGRSGYVPWSLSCERSGAAGPPVRGHTLCMRCCVARGGPWPRQCPCFMGCLDNQGTYWLGSPGGKLGNVDQDHLRRA